MNNSKIENVVFITIDSLRFDRIGGFNDVNGKTPNIDFLAKNGINCINTSSHGCPTQIAMPAVMSSTLPLEHGGYDYGIKKRPIVLAEVFKENKYNTTAFCSGSALTSYYGYNRGFENFFQFTSLDLVWFSYRKLYFNYYYRLYISENISEDNFIHITDQLLKRIFQYLIFECEQKIKQIKGIGIIFDSHVNTINYKELLVVIRSELNELKIDAGKYILNNINNIKVEESSYDPMLADFDFKNYFLKNNNSPGKSYRVKKLILDNIIKTAVDRLSIKWLKINRSYEGMSGDSIMVDNLIKFIKKNNEKKNFIWLHMIDLHGKRYADNIFQFTIRNKNNRNIFQENSDRSYDLSLNHTDKNIGKIINELSNMKILDKTLIVLSSDHGHDAGFPYRNLGLGSASFYEEYVHIPLIFYHPGIKPKTIDCQCCSMDIAPTILDLVDIKIPDEFQGLPVYSSDIAERDNILLEHTHRGPNDIRNKPFYIAVKSDGYKLIWKEYIYHRDPSPEQFEMYELNNDPHEQSNIYSNPSFYDRRMYLEDIVKKRFSELNKERNESPNVN